MMLLKLLVNLIQNQFHNENEWIYIERVLTKGEYHKLGQNVLKRK